MDAAAVVAGVVAELGGAPLAGLSADSRRVGAGEGFLAFPGVSAVVGGGAAAADDGRRYIADALRAGAAAVFWEAEGFAWREEWRAPNRAVRGLRDKAGALADVVYRQPSAQIAAAAVTGTNGKTTITHFAAQLCGEDFPAAVVGTLGAGILGKEFQPLVNTTPDAAELHKLLRGFVDGGCVAAFVEASSHGIVQGRLRGARLAAAVFSNAGRDHLDYHGDERAYWASKAALFAPPFDGVAILNGDVPYCAGLADELRGRGLRVWTYGKNGGALRVEGAEKLADGFKVSVSGDFGRRVFCLPVAGEYNIGNALAAMLLARAVGVEEAEILRRVENLKLPAGRLQKICDSPAVYVDYAHTPDAFAAVLAAFRPAAGAGKLLVVFGCGGGRDQGKRREMGELAARFADEVFITDDNPRNENPAAIRADILAGAAGAAGKNGALNIEGRKNAIAAALDKAGAGDVVLVLGKGHEEGQEAGEKTLPFSDVAVVRELLAGRGGRSERGAA